MKDFHFVSVEVEAKRGKLRFSRGSAPFLNRRDKRRHTKEGIIQYFYPCVAQLKRGKPNSNSQNREIKMFL